MMEASVSKDVERVQKKTLKSIPENEKDNKEYASKLNKSRNQKNTISNVKNRGRETTTNGTHAYTSGLHGMQSYSSTTASYTNRVFYNPKFNSKYYKGYCNDFGYDNVGKYGGYKNNVYTAGGEYQKYYKKNNPRSYMHSSFSNYHTPRTHEKENTGSLKNSPDNVQIREEPLKKVEENLMEKEQTNNNDKEASANFTKTTHKLKEDSLRKRNEEKELTTQTQTKEEKDKKDEKNKQNEILEEKNEKENYNAREKETIQKENQNYYNSKYKKKGYYKSYYNNNNRNHSAYFYSSVNHGDSNDHEMDLNTNDGRTETGGGNHYNNNYYNKNENEKKPDNMPSSENNTKKEEEEQEEEEGKEDKKKKNEESVDEMKKEMHKKKKEEETNIAVKDNTKGGKHSKINRRTYEQVLQNNDHLTQKQTKNNVNDKQNNNIKMENITDKKEYKDVMNGKNNSNPSLKTKETEHENKEMKNSSSNTFKSINLYNSNSNGKRKGTKTLNKSYEHVDNEEQANNIYPNYQIQVQNSKKKYIAPFQQHMYNGLPLHNNTCIENGSMEDPMRNPFTSNSISKYWKNRHFIKNNRNSEFKKGREPTIDMYNDIVECVDSGMERIQKHTTHPEDKNISEGMKTHAVVVPEVGKTEEPRTVTLGILDRTKIKMQEYPKKTHTPYRSRREESVPGSYDVMQNSRRVQGIKEPNLHYKMNEGFNKWRQQQQPVITNGKDIHNTQDKREMIVGKNWRENDMNMESYGIYPKQEFDTTTKGITKMRSGKNTMLMENIIQDSSVYKGNMSMENMNDYNMMQTKVPTPYAAIIPGFHNLHKIDAFSQGINILPKDLKEREHIHESINDVLSRGIATVAAAVVGGGSSSNVKKLKYDKKKRKDLNIVQTCEPNEPPFMVGTSCHEIVLKTQETFVVARELKKKKKKCERKNNSSSNGNRIRGAIIRSKSASMYEEQNRFKNLEISMMKPHMKETKQNTNVAGFKDILNRMLKNYGISEIIETKEQNIEEPKEPIIEEKEETCGKEEQPDINKSDKCIKLSKKLKDGVCYEMNCKEANHIQNPLYKIKTKHTFIQIEKPTKSRIRNHSAQTVTTLYSKEWNAETEKKDSTNSKKTFDAVGDMKKGMGSSGTYRNHDDGIEPTHGEKNNKEIVHIPHCNNNNNNPKGGIELSTQFMKSIMEHGSNCTIPINEHAFINDMNVGVGGAAVSGDANYLRWRNVYKPNERNMQYRLNGRRTSKEMGNEREFIETMYMQMGSQHNSIQNMNQYFQQEEMNYPIVGGHRQQIIMNDSFDIPRENYNINHMITHNHKDSMINIPQNETMEIIPNDFYTNGIIAYPGGNHNTINIHQLNQISELNHMQQLHQMQQIHLQQLNEFHHTGGDLNVGYIPAPPNYFPPVFNEIESIGIMRNSVNIDGAINNYVEYDGNQHNMNMLIKQQGNQGGNEYSVYRYNVNNHGIPNRGGAVGHHMEDTGKRNFYKAGSGKEIIDNNNYTINGSNHMVHYNNGTNCFENYNNNNNNNTFPEHTFGKQGYPLEGNQKDTRMIKKNETISGHSQHETVSNDLSKNHNGYIGQRTKVEARGGAERLHLESLNIPPVESPNANIIANEEFIDGTKKIVVGSRGIVKETERLEMGKHEIEKELHEITYANPVVKDLARYNNNEITTKRNNSFAFNRVTKKGVEEKGHEEKLENRSTVENIKMDYHRNTEQMDYQGNDDGTLVVVHRKEEVKEEEKKAKKKNKNHNEENLKITTEGKKNSSDISSKDLATKASVTSLEKEQKKGGKNKRKNKKCEVESSVLSSNGSSSITKHKGHKYKNHTPKILYNERKEEEEPTPRIIKEKRKNNCANREEISNSSRNCIDELKKNKNILEETKYDQTGGNESLVTSRQSSSGMSKNKKCVYRANNTSNSSDINNSRYHSSESKTKRKQKHSKEQITNEKDQDSTIECIREEEEHKEKNTIQINSNNNKNKNKSKNTNECSNYSVMKYNSNNNNTSNNSTYYNYNHNRNYYVYNHTSYNTPAISKENLTETTQRNYANESLTNLSDTKNSNYHNYYYPYNKTNNYNRPFYNNKNSYIKMIYNRNNYHRPNRNNKPYRIRKDKILSLENEKNNEQN